MGEKTDPRRCWGTRRGVPRAIDFTLSQSIHGHCGDAETTAPGALISRSLGVFVFRDNSLDQNLSAVQG